MNSKFGEDQDTYIFSKYVSTKYLLQRDKKTSL